MNIRSSMYRIVFSLTAVPFLLFSLIITWLYSARLENVLIESLHVVANSQIAEMTDFCEQQKDYLIMLGRMDISRAAMRKELGDDMLKYLNNMLYSRAQDMSSRNSVTLLDSDYRIAACSEDHNTFAHEGIEMIIESMGEEPFFISNILKDDHGRKTLVAIARIEEEDEILGYALMEINLDFYNNIRERAELWNGATFYLLDGQEQIISAGTAEENRDRFVTTKAERADYQKKVDAVDFQSNPQGYFQYTIGGVHYITYYSDVAYTHWKVMLSVNLDAFASRKIVTYIMAFFMVILCTVLAVWIGAFASRRIVSPIKHISTTLNDIRQTQDYSLRVSVDRRDEIGNLCMEINRLINYIQTENLYKAQQQRVLQQKADQDALTKVLNKERIRQYLQEALDRHRQAQTEMAVLFLDVDDFKRFNDRYGHDMGDQVLLFLTSLLVRESGGTVGRVGGDEFLVVMEKPEDVRMLDCCLKRIVAAADSKFVVRGNGSCLPVSCCIGAVRIDFSLPGVEDMTAENVIAMADKVMYQVKNNGKKGHRILDYGGGNQEI